MWEKLLEHQKSINISTVFSYEVIASVHLELCALYAQLFEMPTDDQLLLSDGARRLAEMVETFVHSTHASFTHNSEDYTQLTTVRIKFVSGLLADVSLFELSRRAISQFDAKLVNLIIFAYLNSNVTPVSASSSSGSSSSSTVSSAQSTNAGTLVEKELIHFVTQCVSKLELFDQMNIVFDRSNVELFLNTFIQRYEAKLRSVVNFQDRKPLLENLTIYLHDFLRMVSSINSINSHAIIYKCYLLASQIVSYLSVYLHSRVVFFI